MVFHDGPIRLSLVVSQTIAAHGLFRPFEGGQSRGTGFGIVSRFSSYEDIGHQCIGVFS